VRGGRKTGVGGSAGRTLGAFELAFDAFLQLVSTGPERALPAGKKKSKKASSGTSRSACNSESSGMTGSCLQGGNPCDGVGIGREHHLGISHDGHPDERG
jgi:hypothetical protein